MVLVLAWKIGTEPTSTNENYEWYALGVGLVKSYMRMPSESNGSGGRITGEATVIEELISKNF